MDRTKVPKNKLGEDYFTYLYKNNEEFEGFVTKRDALLARKIYGDKYLKYKTNAIFNKECQSYSMCNGEKIPYRYDRKRCKYICLSRMEHDIATYMTKMIYAYKKMKAHHDLTDSSVVKSYYKMNMLIIKYAFLTRPIVYLRSMGNEGVRYSKKLIQTFKRFWNRIKGKPVHKKIFEEKVDELEKNILTKEIKDKEKSTNFQEFIKETEEFEKKNKLQLEKLNKSDLKNKLDLAKSKAAIDQEKHLETVLQRLRKEDKTPLPRSQITPFKRPTVKVVPETFKSPKKNFSSENSSKSKKYSENNNLKIQTKENRLKKLENDLKIREKSMIENRKGAENFKNSLRNSGSDSETIRKGVENTNENMRKWLSEQYKLNNKDKDEIVKLKNDIRQLKGHSTFSNKQFKSPKFNSLNSTGFDIEDFDEDTETYGYPDFGQKKKSIKRAIKKKTNKKK